ncbi:MAG TPA: phosphoadenylyl-sulfate reductase [Bryobacteraceae bacterium]
MQEAGELIRSVLEREGEACITCSFQVNGVVLLDMLRQVRPDIPVLFIDTGYHFPETYAYRDRLARAWNLNLVNVTPELTVADQEKRFGILYNDAPDYCCEMRKVEPLARALERYDVWFTGLRRGDSATRANIPQLDRHTLPSGKTLLKVNPLAAWPAKDVWAYLRVHEIEHLPLYDQGYTSIGCQPCTRLPVDPSDPRSGRWAGQKLECGIHTFGRDGGGI